MECDRDIFPSSEWVSEGLPVAGAGGGIFKLCTVIEVSLPKSNGSIKQV